jgi:hypothetical protein
MRSPAARLVAFSAVCAALVLSCAARPPCDALGCAPACPRDSSRDGSGRCACALGTVLALGACVSPSIGDVYCGPGERMGVDGCSPRACAPDEAIDLATGACAPRTTVRRGAGGCPDAAVAEDREGAVVCLRTADTCPHGTHRDGDRCARPLACPPGTLPEAGGCRSFVSAAAGPARSPRIDVGTWATLVFGVDGGDGSDDLCRTLARRTDAFAIAPGEKEVALLDIALTLPDQDTTRASASVDVEMRATPGAALAPLPPAARGIVERAVASLVEPFRGLGGESSAAALRLTVRCDLEGR